MLFSQWTQLPNGIACPIPLPLTSKNNKTCALCGIHKDTFWTYYVASQIIMITFCTSFTLPVNNEIHVDISLFSLVSLDWSKCKLNVTSSPLPSTGPKSFQTTHEPMKGSASRPFYYWARFTAHHSNHHHQIHWQWKGHGRRAVDLLANLNECENVDGYWITARSFAIHSRSHSTPHVHIWWPLGIAIINLNKFKN